MDQKEDSATKSKRIVKNTAMLYVRMLLLMLVSLYTSRITLQALGVDNLGIYSVVGGLVSMFSLISGSLTASISRYITYELGRGEAGHLRHVFSTAVNIQICLALLVVLVAETVGLWFLNHRLVIPADRLAAANWVYQFSLITFCASLVMAPYNALIIAHERMSAFAFISIYDGVGKLAIAYLITIAPVDHLVWYASLLLFMTLSTQSIYFIYCLRKFKDCTYKFIIDRKRFREIGAFAGWNFIGSSAALLKDQGVNILLNLFNGPAVNASRLIALQVCGAATGFVGNYQIALNPQITKSYAEGDLAYMIKLIIQGTRFSFYILFLITLPIIIHTDYILALWLGAVPPHATNFVRLTLVLVLCESFAGPLVTAMLATGCIRNFQLVVGGINLLNVPFSYLALRLGYPPEYVIIVAIIVALACQIARVIMLRPLIQFPAVLFFRHVVLNLIAIALWAYIPIACIENSFSESFFSFMLLSAICVVWTMCLIFFIGCNREERTFLKNKLSRVMYRVCGND